MSNKKYLKNKHMIIPNKNHYDYDFLNNMMKYYESDPYFVINSIKDYINIYPNDFNALSLLTAALILVGNFDEAIKYNKLVINKITTEKQYFKNDSKYMKIMSQYKVDKLKIMFAKNSNVELYNYIVENRKDLEYNDDYTMGQILFYLNSRLNPSSMRIDKCHTYMSKQIVDYSEERFIEHMKKHLMGDISEIEKSDALFFEDFDFKKVYEEIKKIEDDVFYVYRGFFDKSSYFRYDNCGLVEGKLTNYFRVIYFRDTNDYITMYPSLAGENLPHIDLNYLKEKDNANVKRLSRADKFRQKYNKFIS